MQKLFLKIFIFMNIYKLFSLKTVYWKNMTIIPKKAA